MLNYTVNRGIIIICFTQKVIYMSKKTINDATAGTARKSMS